MSADEKTDHQLIQEIHATVIALKSDFDHDHEDLREVRCDMYGNGKPGLKSDVTVIKTKLGVGQWLVTTIGGAAITGAVAGLWALLRGR